MKLMEINKKFTEKVAEYIMEGYIINSQSMSGHQGEDAKVDLIKGDKLIRVWMSDEHASNWMDDTAWQGRMMIIRVGVWKYPASRATHPNSIVWMRDLDVLEEQTFYTIDRNSDWYVDNYDEAIHSQRVHYSRYKNYSRTEEKIFDSDRAKEIGSDWLKRYKGYQRVSKDAVRIKKIKYRDGEITYRVCYKSNYYTIG